MDPLALRSLIESTTSCTVDSYMKTTRVSRPFSEPNTTPVFLQPTSHWWGFRSTQV